MTEEINGVREKHFKDEEKIWTAKTNCYWTREIMTIKMIFVHYAVMQYSLQFKQVAGIIICIYKIK